MAKMTMHQILTGGRGMPVTNPDKDRSLSGKARVRARRAANRASRQQHPSRHSGANVGTPTAETPATAPASTGQRYDRAYLNGLTVKDLKGIAKNLGLTHYSNLVKDDLVEHIHGSGANRH